VPTGSLWGETWNQGPVTPPHPLFRGLAQDLTPRLFTLATAILVRRGPKPEHDRAASWALPVGMLNGHDSLALGPACAKRAETVYTPTLSEKCKMGNLDER
jgi:hypothetical protein